MVYVEDRLDSGVYFTEPAMTVFEHFLSDLGERKAAARKLKASLQWERILNPSQSSRLLP